MAQLRVYRSFIKKAADEGKLLIIWDEARRYEGMFKGFDPQGEFLILTDVTIKDADQTITSPEILIPIETIKIVSSETEEEKARRLAGAVAPPAAQAAPSVPLAQPPAAPPPPEPARPEVVEPVAPPAPSWFETEPSFGSEPAGERAVVEPEVSAPEVTGVAPEPAGEVATSEEAAEPAFEAAPGVASGGAGLAGKPEVPEEALEPAREVAAETAESAAKLSEATRSLIEELTAAAEEKVAEEKPREVAGFEAPAYRVVEQPEEKPAMKLEETHPSVEPPLPGGVRAEARIEEAAEKAPVAPTPPLAGVTPVSPSTIEERLAEKAAPGEAVAPAAPAVSTPVAPEPVEKAPAPAAEKEEAVSEKARKISEKSKKASRSPFFAGKKQVTTTAVPKRKVDIGTLILDIMIVILAIIAVLIGVVAIFGIKLPFF